MHTGVRRTDHSNLIPVDCPIVLSKSNPMQHLTRHSDCRGIYFKTYPRSCFRQVTHKPARYRVIRAPINQVLTPIGPLIPIVTICELEHYFLRNVRRINIYIGKQSITLFYMKARIGIVKIMLSQACCGAMGVNIDAAGGIRIYLILDKIPDAVRI